jgi:hypothetical protein
MNKETLLKDLATKGQIIESTIECVNQLQLKTVYKIKERQSDDPEVVDTYGYFESFNRESAKFIVIASDNTKYKDKKWGNIRGYIVALDYIYFLESVWKGSARTFTLTVPLTLKLMPVHEENLPLLIGMKYCSPELELILKGKRKLKYA